MMEPIYIWGKTKPTKPDQQWWYRDSLFSERVVTTFYDHDDKRQTTLLAGLPHTGVYFIVADHTEGEWAGPITTPQEHA